ncbi:uncharacterized protein AB675_8232, partial [Cyphellophora attinorum]
MAERGFRASKKQYKNRITAWGLDKNVKRAEAEAILREHRRRTALGQQCIFVSRGWLVDVANLERFNKRLSPEIRIIVLPTTLSAAITAPSDYETLRALFHYTSVLFHSFFDRDVYTLSSSPPSKSAPSSPRARSPIREHRRSSLPNLTYPAMRIRPTELQRSHRGERRRTPDYRSLDTSYDLTLSALQRLRDGEYYLAGQILDRAFAGLDEVVRSDHPNGIGVVIKTVGACFKAGFGEVGGMVLRFVGELGRVRYREELEGGVSDPRGRLYALLPNVFESLMASSGCEKTSDQRMRRASTATAANASQPPSDLATPSGRNSSVMPPPPRPSRTNQKRSPTLARPSRRPTSSATNAASTTHLVAIYELFCQDLWRKKRPEGAL